MKYHFNVRTGIVRLIGYLYSIKSRRVSQFTDDKTTIAAILFRYYLIYIKLFRINHGICELNVLQWVLECIPVAIICDLSHFYIKITSIKLFFNLLYTNILTNNILSVDTLSTLFKWHRTSQSYCLTVTCSGTL